MSELEEFAAEQEQQEASTDARVMDLRAKVRRLNKRIKEMRQGEGGLLNLFEELRAEIEPLPKPPQYYKPPKTHRSVSTPCFAVPHITDVHYGAEQPADEIEGFNEFSPEIARRRLLEQFIPDVIDWVELHRRTYRLDEAVVPITGDLISGDIHDELRITNAFPAPVQAIGAGELIAAAVSMLAPHFSSVRVEFIVADNHARLTKRCPAREAGLNSLNYVVGHHARSRLSKHKNVDFRIHTTLQAIIKVGARQYLACHGHGIQGWAGFPYYGIDRKVSKEALRRMRRPPEWHFDKVLLGHWHAPLNHPHYMIGGSLSGTDAFDHKCGRSTDPTQTAWLVNPKRKNGEFDWTAFDTDLT